MNKLLAFIFLVLASCTTAPAHAADINLCTGGDNGRYFQTGKEIGSQLKGLVNVNVIATNGSLDNLRKLSVGECDAAIVQSDAYGFYTATNPVAKLDIERVAPLYDEYANLVCNREAGVNNVTDLLRDNRRVLIGPNGSGTAITWQTWAKQQPDYAKVGTDPIGGTRAITKTVDATEAQCFLFVSGLGAGSMMEANELGAGALKLVSVDDGAFDDVLDPKGKRVYEFKDIPGGTYPDLQNHGMFGGQANVRSLAISAVLVANTSWIDANPNGFDDFSSAALRWVQQNR